MTYGVRDSVRKLLGNPSTSDISDSDIDNFIAYGDSQVKSETAKTDWTGTDVQYAMVVEASNYFASSRGREEYTDKAGVADKHYQRALDICARIVKNAALGADEPGIVIRSSSYKTYPLNSKALPYRSITRGSVGVGVVDWSEGP